MDIDVVKKYEEFLSLVETYLPSRAEGLKKMYDDFGDRLLLAPASSMEAFHNAFPGGYIDHIVRVTNFSLEMLELYRKLDMDITFTEENVVFCGLHHDLGKLGLPEEGLELYLPNESEWHRVNQGKIYKTNKQVPFAKIQDRSLYLLQLYNIPMNWEEFLTIRIHDGLYDEANTSYYVGRYEESKLNSNLPYLVHMADLLAARKETELLQIEKREKTPEVSISPSYNRKMKNKKIADVGTIDSSLDTFNKLFGS